MSASPHDDARPGPPGARVVHLWTLHPLRHAAELPRLERLLSPAERRRRERLASAELRDRFTLRRALLRRALGALLGRPPEALVFALGRFGKPRLGGADRERLAFSLTHAGDRTLLVVAQGGSELGVDLTAADALPAASRATVLSAGERTALARLPAARRQRAAASLWAQKEAILKAFGCGLELDPQRLELDPHPDRSPALRRLADADDPLAALWAAGDRAAETPPSRLELQRLDAGTEALAALALLDFDPAPGGAPWRVLAHGAQRPED